MVYINHNNDTDLSYVFSSYELCEQHLMHEFKTATWDSGERTITTDTNGRLTTNWYSNVGLSVQHTCKQIKLSN
jgi:hypothetical protein